MFCKKCGNELKDGAQFCGKCGTPVTDAQTASAAPKASVGFSPAALSSSADGLLPIKYLAAAGSYILLLIFLFIKYIKISAFGMSEGASLSKLVDSGFFSTITVIMCLVSACLCVYPIIANKMKDIKMVIFPAVTTLWMFIWFLAKAIKTASDAKKVGYGLVKTSLTFGGWLYILLFIASFAILGWIIYDIVKANKN